MVRTIPGMQVLPVELATNGRNSKQQHVESGKTTRLTSTQSGGSHRASLPTHQNHQVGIQRMDRTDQMSRLWGDHPEDGESQTKREDLQFVINHPNVERRNGRVDEPVGGVPTIQEDAGAAPPLTTKSPTEETELDLDRKTINPTNIHRMEACLNNAICQWNYLIQFCEDPTKYEPDVFLQHVCNKLEQDKSKKHVKNIAQLFHLEPSSLRQVSEIFNPNRFGPATKRHGLNQGQVFDITLGDDLLKKEAQETVLSHIMYDRPGLTIISPPCGPFSALQNLSASLRTHDWNAAKRHMIKLREARIKLLHFAMQVCALCHSLGLSFLFEHPRTARSWLEKPVQQLLRHPDIELVHGDQCMLGLKSKATGIAIKKPTGFLGNNKTILEALKIKCSGDHQHEQLVGSNQHGPRSAQAQEYPNSMVNTILKAYARSCNLRPHELHQVQAYELIHEDYQVNGNYFEELELNEIFAEQDDLPVQAVYGALQNQFTESAKANYLPESSQPWHFWSRTDLDTNNYQITKGDSPHFQTLTFRLRGQSLIKLDKISELADEQHEQELPESKQDTVTVFAWRRSRDLAGARQISLERLVRRAHEGLGHPELNRFVRILKASRARPEVIEIAKNLKCSVCQQFRNPSPMKHSAPPRENLQFNQLVGIDTVHLRNHKHQPVPALSIIDYSSHFQLVIPMNNSTAGKTFKTMLYKTMATTSCTTEEEWKACVDTTTMMRNRLLLRGGYSPIQRVMGFTPRLPGELMIGREPHLRGRAPNSAGDMSVMRSMEIRRAAAHAFSNRTASNPCSKPYMQAQGRGDQSNQDKSCFSFVVEQTHRKSRLTSTGGFLLEFCLWMHPTQFGCPTGTSSSRLHLNVSVRQVKKKH